MEHCIEIYPFSFREKMQVLIRLLIRRSLSESLGVCVCGGGGGEGSLTRGDLCAVFFVPCEGENLS